MALAKNHVVIQLTNESIVHASSALWRYLNHTPAIIEFERLWAARLRQELSEPGNGVEHVGRIRREDGDPVEGLQTPEQGGQAPGHPLGS